MLACQEARYSSNLAELHKFLLFLLALGQICLRGCTQYFKLGFLHWQRLHLMGHPGICAIHLLCDIQCLFLLYERRCNQLISSLMHYGDKALFRLQRSISLELPVIDNQSVVAGFLSGYMNRKNECFFVGIIFSVCLIIRRIAAFVPYRRQRCCK